MKANHMAAESHSLFEIGDFVEAVGNSALHCGSGWYPHAIVVSVKPLKLVSEETDMLWTATLDSMSLRRTGRKATAEELKLCERRL